MKISLGDMANHQHSDENKMTKWRVLFTVILSIVFFASGSSIAMGGDVIEQFKTGSVNWTRGTIRASGVYLSPKTSKGCEKALSNAKINAYHNLLDTLKAITVKDDQTVGDLAGHNDNLMVRLMDMAKEARLVEQKYQTNGAAEAVVEMSLFDGFSQLVLPMEIRQVESIKAVKSNRKPLPAGPETGDPVIREKEIYSGLIVDARGLNVRKIMALKVLDENHQEIYGPAFVSREIAVQKGMCHYETDMAAARGDQKMGENPLTVKGLRVNGSYGTDIVISNSDALKIKSASEHLLFLKQCRVYIVVDPPSTPG